MFCFLILCGVRALAEALPLNPEVLVTVITPSAILEVEGVGGEQ